MPAKKIDPEAKKILEKRETVKRKLAFAGAIGALVIITNLLMVFRGDARTTEANAEDERAARVLGQSGELSADEKARLGRVQEQATELAQSFSSGSEKLVAESKEQVEERISDVVYTTTIKPLVDKIQGLPEDQQEYIREQLCRESR